jgi:hypothetical protein
MVGDERERHALRLQPAHLREQALDLLAIQWRGRLVEDAESRAIGKRPRDFDELPRFDFEIAGARAFGYRDIPAIEHLAGVSPERAPGDEAATKRLPVDEQVFGNRQVRGDRRMRVDAGDALAPPFAVGDGGARSPRKRTSPLSGSRRPVRMPTSVDFPAPLRPTRACDSPDSTRKRASLSAIVAP